MAAGDTRILKVKVVGDTASATTAIKKLGDETSTTGGKFKIVGTEAEEANGHVGRFGNGLKSMAGSMVAGVAGGLALTFGLEKLGEGLKDCLGDAVDMQKTQERVNTLFGSGSGQITEWAENAAKSMGLSKDQAETAAAGFAIYGKQAGLTGKNLVTFGEQTTKTANDLASFKNADPTAVMKAMTSALAGNYRGLKQYGIVITKNNLQQTAMQLGIKGTSKDWTDQQKVLIVHADITNQARFAQDNFSKSSSDTANKQKILAAEVANVKDKIGSALLPILQKIMGFMSSTILPGFLQFVNGLTGSKNAAGALGDAGKILNGVFQATAQTISDVVGWIKQHKQLALELAIAIGGIVLAVKAWDIAQWALNVALDANPIGLVIAALAALVIGIDYAWHHSKTFRDIVTGAWKDIKGTVSAVSDWFKNTLWPTLQNIYNWIANKVTWLYNVYKGEFNLIKTVVMAVVNWFTNSFWPTVEKIWNFIGNKVAWLKNGFVSAFGGIRNTVQTVIDWFKGTFEASVSTTFNTVKGTVTKTLNAITSGFDSTVDAIGSIWSTLSNMFAVPIKFLVNTVYDDGIAKLWNDVAKVVPGMPHLPTFSFNASPPKALMHGLAEGGPVTDVTRGGMVRGRGGPTQDKIHAMLSDEEFVVKASSVKKIGLGYLNALNDTGGDPSGAIVNAPNHYAGGGLVKPRGESVPQVLSWLRSIAGRVPYVLGADGPNAFDCSSLVGNVWARLTGNPINRRYFVTGTENSWLLSHGFKRGSDPSGFTVGLTSPSEHTVGMLAGHRFEAAHTGTRMRYDDGAANATHFSRTYHMVGGAGSLLTGVLAKIAATAGQATGYMQKPVDKLIGNMPKSPSGIAQKVGSYVNDKATSGVQSVLNKAIAAANAAAASGFGAGSALGSVGSSQIEKWIAQASKFADIPLSWVPGIETIIRRESGGNPRAINRTDINAQHGDPSRGLMQTIMTTFRANHAPGTSNDIYDPVANIAAAVNYIHRRYGSIFNVQQANPHARPRGYDSGGWLDPNGGIGINSGGKPEAVLTPAESAGLKAGGSIGGGGDLHVHMHFDGATIIGSDPKSFVREILPELKKQVKKATKGQGGVPFFED